MPAGAPAVPPPTTTTSYVPSTGRGPAGDSTVGSPLSNGRRPVRNSRVSQGGTQLVAPATAPLVTVATSCDPPAASRAAAAPTSAPFRMNANGRGPHPNTNTCGTVPVA